ncbi:MAG: DegV family protein [Chloroflexi bacterium]|nr:DegV family protein [Chloroflexota bacterium]MCL5110534.1 DegV family protein [Chloroflexota bacterium]
MHELARIRVVTDSTANLPPQLAASRGIEVVPLQLLIDSQCYADGIDITNDQFYDLLKHCKALPTTSQPSAGEFVAVYERLLKEGADSIVSLHISHHLSGTYASAVAARALMPKAKITVIDTLSVSMGLGLLALRAVQEIEEGADHEQTVATIERLVPNVRVLFVVDTLEYLHKGGRIGGASALLGSLLDLKPILAIKEGIIQPVERVRTKSKALDRLMGLIAEDLPVSARPHGAVIHGKGDHEAALLLGWLKEQYDCAQLLIGEVGPVIATHTGPGVFGVTYYCES